MKTPRFWQHTGALSMVLRPAAWAYGIAARGDRTRTQQESAPLPVISIGNATVGGTGKTPTAIALVPLLQALGHTPHILTRGYGGAQRLPHRVAAEDHWQQVGDEALLLARHAPTWVGRDRLASAREAHHAGASLVLCDDAHQHHRLHKNLSFLVVDGAYGIGNGMLLPAGPLREPWADALARAQAVILIGEDAQGITAALPIPVFSAQLTPTGDVTFLKETPWLAFAGIGRPEKFYTSLLKTGADIIATENFADHHPYNATEIEALLARAQQVGARLITTEKDWVKIPHTLQSEIHRLPVACQFADPAAMSDFLRHALGA